MSGVRRDELRVKNDLWLPHDDHLFLSEYGLDESCWALTHPTASAEENMEVSAAYGDSHLKSCLAAIFHSRYPHIATTKEVEPLRVSVKNVVLTIIVKDLLKLSSDDVAVGPEYLHAGKQRSTHRMGSILEALVTAVLWDKGYDVCTFFV